MQAPFMLNTINIINGLLIIGKPGYLNNLLKRRAILSQVKTSDAILLDADTTRSVFNARAFSSVVPTEYLTT